MQPKRKKKPPLKKRIMKSTPVIVLASYLLAFMLRVLYLANRIERHIPESARPYLNSEKPALFCFWHGRLSMQAFMKPERRTLYALISNHADGRLISTVLRRFAARTVHGSSSKGVKGAVEALQQAAREGGHIVFTPDGPRGPFQKAAKGAAYVAIKTGYPVIGLSFSSTRYIRFRSWDRFMLPKPFGRIVYIVAEPLQFGPDDSDEAVAAATQTIETMLNRVTDDADRICGVIP